MADKAQHRSRGIAALVALTLGCAMALAGSGVAWAHGSDDAAKKGDHRKAQAATSEEETTSSEESRHPSGKDRTVEPGGSGTQGKSTSDPDGDSNGGMDKPGEAGGLQVSDQDGNNGCGNDNDFEDDNNGRCLGRQNTEVSGENEENDNDTETSGTSVLGTRITRSNTAPKAAVLGERLARTGLGIAGFTLAGLALLSLGVTMLRDRRNPFVARR